MDEHELRRLATQRLGRQIPAWVWKLLRLDGYLDPEEDDDPDVALERIRQLLQIGPTAAAPMSRRSAPQPKLRRTEFLRARAASEYTAAAAAQEAEVVRFRAEMLGGRLLSAEEADAFVTSPAVCLFSPGEFLVKGVPIARHEATVVRQRVGAASYGADLRVSPPGTVWTFHRDRAPQWPWAVGQVRGDHHMPMIMRGHPVEITFWEGSALHVLIQVAERLGGRNAYPWNVPAAIEFILTGVTPFIAPLGSSVQSSLSSHGNRVTVTLKLEPWLSAQTLLAFYRVYQQRLLGRSNRPLSERRLELVSFVLTRMTAEPQPSWREIMREWNAAHRRWTYTDVRNIARDYWAGVRQVAFPRISGVLEEGNRGKARKR